MRTVEDGYHGGELAMLTDIAKHIEHEVGRMCIYLNDERYEDIRESALNARDDLRNAVHHLKLALAGVEKL